MSYLSSMLENIRVHLRQFKDDARGNVIVTFTLLLIPIMGTVGAAVDYSRANSVKGAMQAAADATALMLSKTAASLTNSALQTKANDIFKALLNRPEATGVTVAAVYSTDGGSKVVVNATSDVKADFTSLLGITTMKVGVSAQASWGSSRLRVALVLDTTGSMNQDGKIEAMKTASKSLLAQLKAGATQNGDVYVSIIPFVKDVNVGASNYNASWIDWTDWDNNNGSCYNNANYNGNPTSDSTKTSCVGNGKYWQTASHNTWNGCVTDRGNSQTPHAGNYDTNVSMPDIGNPATLFPAEQYGSCPKTVMPLNYDWTGMSNLIDSINANGNTNQGIGIAHGWQSLVGGGPYPTPPVEETGYTYAKIIILMSDGLNTQNRWYSNQNQIDAREAMTCTNAKASGITIYTVQVNTGGDPTQSVMKNCASSADKFTEIKSANQLVTTFNKIGSSLTSLRIAK